MGFRFRATRPKVGFCGSRESCVFVKFWALDYSFNRKLVPHRLLARAAKHGLREWSRAGWGLGRAEGAGFHGKVLGLVVRQLVPESVPRHRLERNKAVFRGTLARRGAGFDEQALRLAEALRSASWQSGCPWGRSPTRKRVAGVSACPTSAAEI